MKLLEECAILLNLQRATSEVKLAGSLLAVILLTSTWINQYSREMLNLLQLQSSALEESIENYFLHYCEWSSREEGRCSETLRRTCFQILRTIHFIFFSSLIWSAPCHVHVSFTSSTSVTVPRRSIAKLRCNRRLHMCANRKLGMSEEFGQSEPSYTPINIHCIKVT
jgi:hypothetical protein